MPLLSLKKKLGIGLVLLLILSAVFFFAGNKKVPEVTVQPEVVTKQPVVKKDIGKSVEGRNIELYSYGKGDTHVTLVGGIHGGYEWNGVLLAYGVMDYLEQNPDIIPDNITVDVIPSINPDAVFNVTSKDGRFEAIDVTKDTKILEANRFNAHEVDLNRNFDCNWTPKSTWRSATVSAGASAFSEPEAMAFKNYVAEVKPDSVIFWHSQSNAIYASQCGDGIIPQTLEMMNVYSKASGYNAVETFDAYAVTGAADDWLASIGIPAFTVELKTHESIDWEKNLAGFKATLDYYRK